MEGGGPACGWWKECREDRKTPSLKLSREGVKYAVPLPFKAALRQTSSLPADTGSALYPARRRLPTESGSLGSGPSSGMYSACPLMPPHTGRRLSFIRGRQRTCSHQRYWRYYMMGSRESQGFFASRVAKVSTTIDSTMRMPPASCMPVSCSPSSSAPATQAVMGLRLMDRDTVRESTARMARL